MEHDLFKPYKIEPLFQRMRHELEIIERDAINAPSVIDARTKALQAVQSYEPKTSDGTPLPPEVIRMTQEEAKRLGNTATTVKVADLIKLTSMEMAQPADYARQCCAAYLLEQGPRAVDDNDVSFQMARAAYDILANPGTQNDDVKQGTSLLEALGKYRRLDSAAILLIEDEYETLKTGQFSKMNGAFSPAEQMMRSHINSCIANSFSPDIQYRLGYKKYKAVFDPERIRNIESIMSMDSTSECLLNYKKERNIPVILFDYIEAPKPGDNIAIGYCRHEENFKYLMLFTNNNSDAKLALIYTHEMRHLWQDEKIPLNKNRLTLLDAMIVELLKEGDAHAVMSKVYWNFSNKIKTQSVNFGVKQHLRAFADKFEDVSLNNLSLPERMKQATQAAFLCFLEQEFAELRYIHTITSFTTQYAGRLDYNLRTLPKNRFLTDAFLQSLSHVSQSVSYLDKEGRSRIRDMFIENLPRAIERCKASPPSGPTPSP
jgi:hypothetical protein